jgi:hypothetical protein
VCSNGRHLGGNAEIQELDATGQLDKAYAAMLEEPPSLDDRLKMPTYPPAVVRAPAARSDDTICIGESTDSHGETVCVQGMSYFEIEEILQAGLDIKDHKKSCFSKHKKTFVGEDAVDFFVNSSAFARISSREQAVAFGSKLLGQRLFAVVTGGPEFTDSKSLYRMQSNSEAPVLNKLRIWTDRVDDPMVTIKAVSE